MKTLRTTVVTIFLGVLLAGFAHAEVERARLVPVDPIPPPEERKQAPPSPWIQPIELPWEGITPQSILSWGRTPEGQALFILAAGALCLLAVVYIPRGLGYTSSALRMQLSRRKRFPPQPQRPPGLRPVPPKPSGWWQRLNGGFGRAIQVAGQKLKGWGNASWNWGTSTWKAVREPTWHFVAGLSAEVAATYSFGGSDALITRGFGREFPEHSPWYWWGRTAGSVVGALAGAGEVVAGAGMIIGGAGVAAGGTVGTGGLGGLVAVPAGAGLTAAGKATVAHGSVVVATASVRARGNLNRALHATRTARPSGTPKPWGGEVFTKEVEFQGMKVYQREDINWSLRDARGRTNLERAKQGLAPMGKDGNPINLHHVGQKPSGPIAEVLDSVHKENYAVLHKQVGPSRIDRPDFDNWRRAYWRWRARQVEGGQAP